MIIQYDYYIIQRSKGYELPMLSRLKELDHRIPVFLPITKYMIIWYFVMIIALAVDYFFSIYYLCFHSSDLQFRGKTITLPIFALIFLIDILISLNTSFIENGRIINDKKTIRLRYATNFYLFLDLIALTSIIVQWSIAINHPAISLLVFVRVLKISQFDTLIRKYSLGSSQIKLAYQILKHFILLIMVCHFIGSLFFYLDIKLIQAGWYSNDMLWVYSSYAYNNIIDLPSYWQYAYSFYYAVVTLSGVAYGDLTPLNPTEAIYTFLSLLFPLIIYTYIFSVLHQLIREQQQKNQEIIDFRRAVKKYLEESGIAANEIPKFINYLSYTYESQNKLKSDFLNEIAPSLKISYMQSIIKNNYDFSLFTPLLLGSVSMKQIQQAVIDVACQQAYPSKQLINSRNCKNMKLFYIANGEVYEQILLKSNKFRKRIQCKHFFSQYAFFTGLAHKHAGHQFETKTFSIFHSMSLQKFLHKIKVTSTHLFQSYHQLRYQLLFSNAVQKLNHKCFFCQEKDHFVDNCNKLRLKVNALQCIDKRNIRNQKYVRKCKIKPKQFSFFKSVAMLSSFFKEMTCFQVEKEEKCIQTEHRAYLTQQSALFLSKMDVVRNWSLFQKQYSF